MKSIKTEVLNDKLYKSTDLKDFLKENASHLRTDSFNHFLYDLITESKMKNSELFAKANMSESYGYQLLNGKRQPSRDKILQLAIGLSLDMEKTNQMLKLAEKSELYVKNKRDAVIMFAIVNKLNIIETNELLDDEKHDLLSS